MANVACGSVGTGTERLPWTAIARDGDAYLPRAGGHHPEVAREQPPVIRRSHRDIRCRRELRPWARQRQRHDSHVVDVRRGGQDFNVGDARHGIRRPHGHEHAIGSRLAVEEYIRASHVRRCASLEQRRHPDGDNDQQGNKVAFSPSDFLHRASGAECQPHHQTRHECREQYSGPERRCGLVGVEFVTGIEGLRGSAEVHVPRCRRTGFSQAGSSESSQTAIGRQ